MSAYGQSADTDCNHHSCYRGRYIILNRPDISAVKCCNRACVFPCAVMAFKAQLGLVPNYLTQLFNLNNNINHQLRSNNRSLYIPKARTNFLKNSFSYRGAVSWNNLPHNIIDRAITGNISLSSFKNSITNISVLEKIT